MVRGLLGGLQARLLMVVALAVVPALGLALLSLSRHQGRELAEVEDQTTRLAGLIAVEEQRLFDETRELLIVLSHDGAIQAAQADECASKLAHLREHFARYDNFGLIGLDGRVVCSAVPLAGLPMAGTRSGASRADRRSTSVTPSSPMRAR